MSAIEPESLARARPGAILIAGFIGFLAGQVIAAFLTAVGAALTHYPGGVRALVSLSVPPWWVIALGLVGLWVGMGAAIAYAYGPGRLPTWPGQWRPRVRDLMYLPLGIALQGLVNLAYLPFHVHNLNKPVQHLFGGASGVSFALIGVMSVVMAPVMEELFFRGVIYRGLAVLPERRGSRGLAAVVVSAVLFAAAHGEVAQFVGLFAVGVVLAEVVRRTRRLGPAMAIHVGFNLTAYVALALSRAGH